ncbi:MAG: hypothetical protein A4E63_03568 [Syntrophorhabdus sp. PtaU1.Bin050]|nr:MAG: hypothetical protein A4E63_03568 [Syntrophorhabdus sp. PtaU1.Bin050]
MAGCIALARNIMTEFARNTGLFPAANVPRRYLWTDAFAVCNFLGLHRETGNKDFMDLALRLVDQVHATLGRHRLDDIRTGPISGLAEEEAGSHPAAGGLRIGKELSERRSNEPLDEHLEWDRDGQYFHYLTKWMHALNRVTKATGDFTYNQWAIELARTAHARFAYTPFHGGQKRMYWKMSIDLSYPLVASMGFHDPLDGLITYTQLTATAAEDPEVPVDLKTEIADIADMCKGRRWVTTDLLGVGGLLSDAFRVAQLMVSGCFSDSHLLFRLLDDSLASLEALDGGSLEESLTGLAANYRLAFRELGLSIGLRAIEKLSDLIARHEVFDRERTRLKSRIARLQGYEQLAKAVESFWLEPEHQGETWMDHQDINMVMLATSLSPAGYLVLGSLKDSYSDDL